MINKNTQKTKITKEFLNKYNYLQLVFENVDVYTINVEHILQFEFNVTLNAKKDVNLINDGFLKISKLAKNIMESSDGVFLSCDYYNLFDRLQLCDGCADITSICLKGDEGKIDFYTPYDPLLSVINMCEIEYSNSPSATIDAFEDVTVGFGSYSKMPTRIDNNYSDLIGGWKEFLGNYTPKFLSVKDARLELLKNGLEKFYLSVTINDKSAPKKHVEFIFCNCKNVGLDISFNNDGKSDIVASKLVNGEIYFGLEDLGIEFTCSNAYVLDYYNKINK